MYKRVILFFLLFFVFLSNIFSTNVNIKYDNFNNSIDLSIYDNLNKVGIKFTNSKIDTLNLLNYSLNGLKIKKENKFKDKEIYISKTLNYYINIEKGSFAYFTNFIPLNRGEYSINSLSYNKDIFKFEFLFYNINKDDRDLFYYDYSNLKYTKKGVINYLFIKFKNIDLHQEFAISKYGIIYSTMFCLNYKKAQIFILNKNINEKFRYGFVLNNDPIRFEINEKLYPISIYSGQGKKREYNVKSEINFEILSLNLNIIMKINHQIIYDKYLKKSINNDFNIKSNFKYKKLNLELGISVEKIIKYYLIINNAKFIYNEDEFFIQLDYLSRRENKKYLIKLSSKGIIEISYSIFL